LTGDFAVVYLDSVPSGTSAVRGSRVQYKTNVL